MMCDIVCRTSEFTGLILRSPTALKY